MHMKRASFAIIGLSILLLSLPIFGVGCEIAVGEVPSDVAPEADTSRTPEPDTELPPEFDIVAETWRMSYPSRGR